MRLYLSSFGLGHYAPRLVQLAGRGRRAAIVLNACDLMPEDARQVRLRTEMTALAGLGFHPEELDLRDFFNRDASRGALIARLASIDLVWVRGGNSFVLRRAFTQSGLDDVLPSRLREDSLMYGGYSAAIAVLGPTLRGIELVDDPHPAPAGYDPAFDWSGLHLLPYVVAPHYRSEHPESPAIDLVVQYYIDRHILFRAIRDGEVIVVEGDRHEILSPASREA